MNTIDQLKSYFRLILRPSHSPTWEHPDYAQVLCDRVRKFTGEEEDVAECFQMFEYVIYIYNIRQIENACTDITLHTHITNCNITFVELKNLEQNQN